MALDSDEECDSDAGFEVVAAQDHARAADSQHARHAALLPPAKRRRDIPANAPESPRLFDQHDQHSFDSAAGAPVAAASSKGTPEGVTLPCPGSQPPTVRQSTARSRRPALEDNNTNHSEAASERGGPTGSVSGAQLSSPPLSFPLALLSTSVTAHCSPCPLPLSSPTWYLVLALHRLFFS